MYYSLAGRNCCVLRALYSTWTMHQRSSEQLLFAEYFKNTELILKVMQFPGK